MAQVYLIGTISNFLSEVKEDKQKQAELMVEKALSEIIYKTSDKEERSDLYYEFLDKNNIPEYSEVEDWDDDDEIKEVIKNNIERLPITGLIIEDMLNLFAHGDKGRCEILVKDESTLHHMKTIKYALEGTISAKVVSDTVKLLINENDETLEVLEPSKELIQALNEEKQKIIQGE